MCSQNSVAIGISYTCHSIVYDNHNTTSPTGAVTLGATYEDNIVYAWGDIPAGTFGTASPLIPNSSFGVLNVAYNGANMYTITLNNIAPNGTTTLANRCVTATIVSPGQNTDPGCTTIAVSPLVNNVFNVWTHFVNFGTSTCDSKNYRFNFKVCGR